MELRERVARAIYDAPDSQSGDSVGTVIWSSEHLFFDSVGGEEIVDTAWRASMPVCLSAADAAIAAVLNAMHDPTGDMVRAAVEAAEKIGYTDVVGIYRAMLAAFRAELLPPSV